MFDENSIEAIGSTASLVICFHLVCSLCFVNLILYSELLEDTCFCLAIGKWIFPFRHFHLRSFWGGPSWCLDPESYHVPSIEIRELLWKSSCDLTWAFSLFSILFDWICGWIFLLFFMLDQIYWILHEEIIAQVCMHGLQYAYDAHIPADLW